MTLNPDDLEAKAQALAYRGGDEQVLALDTITLIAKLREAEAVISEALNHDPLHGSKEGLHCGGNGPLYPRNPYRARTVELREMRP